MSGGAEMPSGGRASWLVVCDFDGTISQDDVTDSLMLRFARPGWQELEAQWEAGRIGSRACMAGQVALLDCTKEELDAHVAGLPIDPGFRSFVEGVSAGGASLTIASDGLDVAIAAMLARAGLAHLLRLRQPTGTDRAASLGAAIPARARRLHQRQRDVQVRLLGQRRCASRAAGRRRCF